MGKVFNLGKLFGIEFRLHFTWFVIFILVTVLLVYPNYTQWLYWVIGVITSLLFFASVLAHELAHSLVGRANGIPIKSITLFIFGGVAQMTREATRAAAEFRMAAAGPICSLLIGGLFGLFLLIPNMPEPIATMIRWLAIMNGVLAVFNMVPGFPLDGGRVLRSLLWRFTGNYSRSTRIATRVGQGIGYLLGLAGILIIILSFILPSFSFSWFDGVWIVFIGWFLESAASASYNQIRREEALQSFNALSMTHPEHPVIPPYTQD
ncbi:site-2 protease family protein [Chloroflexota bacterium]